MLNVACQFHALKAKVRFHFSWLAKASEVIQMIGFFSDNHLRLRAGDSEASTQLQKVRGRSDPLHAAQEQHRARIHQRKRHHQIPQRRGKQVHQLLQVPDLQPLPFYFSTVVPYFASTPIVTLLTNAKKSSFTIMVSQNFYLKGSI